MMFKVDSFVKHKEQGIQGRVLYSDRHDTTIYDEDCPNDDDYEGDSYGSGSALTFKTYELEPIERLLTEEEWRQHESNTICN